MSRNDRANRRRKRDRKTNPAPMPSPASWELVFEDHFDSEILEPWWSTQFPWGRDRSNVGELQWYGDDAFRVSDSLLTIEARDGGPAGFRYTSGLISTHGNFVQTFGRFEIRCRVPQGKGLWPAFWLLPVDQSWPPEIDVFEIIGSETDHVHLTVHLQENSEHRSYGGEFEGPDFAADFHEFALEWSADRCVWLVDDVERHRVERPMPRVPMYLVVNLAVGGNWPGEPDEHTRFPAAFEIDSIRAWKRAA